MENKDITELKEEREALRLFGDQLNKIYLQKDVYIDFVTCETMSQVVVQGRMQDEINKNIEESDYFTIIIGENVGEYTEEEFNVALSHFKGYKKPYITT